MKFFALIFAAIALTQLVTGCSFAITPLLFLIDSNEVGRIETGLYADSAPENFKADETENFDSLEAPSVKISSL